MGRACALLLAEHGYWREDMGAYGWNDVEWAFRLKARGVRSVVLPDVVPTRDDDKDPEYRGWRDARIAEPLGPAGLRRSEADGWRAYAP